MTQAKMSMAERIAYLKQKKEMESVVPVSTQEVPEVGIPVVEIQKADGPLGLLQEKLEELRNMLLADHPALPRLLQQIHSVMLEQGDLVIQLSDQEIGIFIQALKNHMNVTVVAEKTKKATSSAALKKSSNAELLGGGMDDLAKLAASFGVSM